MFGFSKIEKSHRMYKEGLASILKSLVVYTPEKKLPGSMWADPYMIGYFFKMVNVLEIMIWNKSFKDPRTKR